MIPKSRWLATIAASLGLAALTPHDAHASGAHPLLAPLSNEEAWKAMPPAEVGSGKPLPSWARMLARSLPRTTAAILRLDYAQRARSPLDPKLRAAMRFVAARANGSTYGETYAASDATRAGLDKTALVAPAPDFTLPKADGTGDVTLSMLVGSRPVVLIFGTFTCGPFRAQAGNIEKLYERYKDRAEFVMVYVREPHPTDGWRMENNDRVGVARTCSRSLRLCFPILVDTMDDAANNLSSGLPGRLYLIDLGGKVAFKNGRGPFGFKLAELEQSLILLLRQDESASAASGPR